MNRPLTALFAALEALLVVGIGIGIPLVPLTFMWAFQYGLQLDWTVFWRASVDFWLVGHGTDITFTLDSTLATSAGFADAGAPFAVSIAALGVGLLTLLLAIRAGRRIAETPYARLGSFVATLVVAGLAFVVTFSALHDNAMPSLVQGILFPTLVFATGLLLGLGIARRRLNRMPGRQSTPSGLATQTGFATETGLATQTRRARQTRLGRWWTTQPAHTRGVFSNSLRGGIAVVAVVFLVASVLLALMILLNYAQVIALYEGIHSGVLGGFAVTMAELSFLPNLVVWSASWLVGPGFAIGVGSSVSPLGTSLGPLPAIPIFGALPTGDLAFGFLGLLVPIVAAFIVGVVIRPGVVRSIDRSPATLLMATGVGIGLVGGVLMGVLAWMSGGAAGPGRLVEVGPNAVMVGLFAALEFGVPAILGLLVGRSARST